MNQRSNALADRLEHGALAVTKEATLDLLRRNSAGAAAAIRALTDDQLDNSARVSLYSDAPLTCQFFLEDHPVRHSYHHLAGINRTLSEKRQPALEMAAGGC